MPYTGFDELIHSRNNLPIQYGVIVSTCYNCGY